MTSNTKASESELSELHGKLNLLYTHTANTILQALDSESSETKLEALKLASPALLTSMANWVKMNGITCQPEDVAETSDLMESLKKKRESSRMSGTSRILDISSIPSISQ